MGQLLVDDVERRRRETVSEFTRELQKFAEGRREAEKHSAEMLARIRSELANLERLTTVLRAPLRDKIAVLRGLRLERSSADADVERYMAILVLKEMEDAELVRRERLENEAAGVVSDLLVRDILRDDFFAEVRFRLVRVVGELGLVDMAGQQVSNPNSWERGSFILLLGALGQPKAIPVLVRVVRDKAEPTDLREKAIRSLAAIGGRSPEITWPHLAVPYGWIIKERGKRSLRAREWEDGEIERMRPRSGRLPVLTKPEKVTEEWVRQSADAVSSVISARTEPVSLRKVALKALRRLGGPEVIGIVRQVLLEEWETYAEEAIDILAERPAEVSVATLREFALMVRPERSLRLRCVEALGEIETRPALSALREIAERSPDTEIRNAAREASKALAERVK